MDEEYLMDEEDEEINHSNNLFIPEGVTYVKFMYEYGREAYNTAYNHGFWANGPTFQIEELQTKLMLIVTEVAEASECLRLNANPHHTYERADGKPEGFCYELADVFIRVADLAYACGLDLDRAVQEKMAFNKTRPYKHGKTI